MMFSKTLIVSSMAMLAAATPTGTPPAAPPASQCNVGGLQCCNSVQSSSNSVVSTLLGLLGVVLGGVNVPIGLTCSGINILGILGNGNQCTANPVCCENNTFNGIIAIGCSPITLGL